MTSTASRTAYLAASMTSDFTTVLLAGPEGCIACRPGKCLIVCCIKRFRQPRIVCAMPLLTAHVSLQACSGSVERAADWLFSHADDLDAAVASVSSAGGAATTAGRLGCDPLGSPSLLVVLAGCCIADAHATASPYTHRSATPSIDGQ